MTTLNEAIEMFRGDMRRRQLLPNSQNRYGRELERFALSNGGDMKTLLDLHDEAKIWTVVARMPLMPSTEAAFKA
jgi:hypothetical protein